MRVIVCVCLSVYVCACVYVFVCVSEYILEMKAPIVDFIWRFEMILDLGLEIAHEFLQSTYVLVWVRTLPPHSNPVCCGVLHHVAACSKCSELLSSPYILVRVRALCVAEWCSVLQCCAACCIVVQIKLSPFIVLPFYTCISIHIVLPFIGLPDA